MTNLFLSPFYLIETSTTTRETERPKNKKKKGNVRKNFLAFDLSQNLKKHKRFLNNEQSCCCCCCHYFHARKTRTSLFFVLKSSRASHPCTSVANARAERRERVRENARFARKLFFFFAFFFFQRRLSPDRRRQTNKDGMGGRSGGVGRLHAPVVRGEETER